MTNEKIPISLILDQAIEQSQRGNLHRGIENLMGMKVISDPSLPVGTGEFRSTKTGECVGKISIKPE